MQMHQAKESFIEHFKAFNNRQMDNKDAENHQCTNVASTSTVEVRIPACLCLEISYLKMLIFALQNQNIVDVEMDLDLEDLEVQRQALLAQLDEDDSPPGDGDYSNLDKIEPLDPLNKAEDKSTEATNSSLTKEPSNEEKGSDSISEQNMSPKQSKLLAMGTPVSIRFSPYNALPTREKFAQNMGDLELFENLPSSTGAFQKMRSLLQKVRKVITKK